MVEEEKRYAAYRVDEVAKAWGVSEKTIDRWMKAGDIGYFQILHTRRILPEHIAEFRAQFPEYPDIPLKEIPPRKKLVVPSRLYGNRDEATVQNITEAMGDATRRFDHDEVKLLRSPIVYAWARNGKLLYIGKSINGLVRPIDPHHHRLEGIAAGDELLIWACATAKACERMEIDLIRRFKPMMNNAAGDPNAKIA